MALLWLDSFDHYLTADIGLKYANTAGVGSYVTIDPTGGRRSGGALLSTNNGQGVTTPPFTAPSTTVSFGCAVKLIVNPSQVGAFQLLSAGASQVQVVINTAGKIELQRGNGTVLGTSTAVIPLNVFFYLEAQIVIHPSAGSANVRINEVIVLTVTGVNTAQSGTAVWDAFKILTPWTTGTAQQWVDDLYVCDSTGAAPLNTLLGDVRIDARYPTAEGASSAWTPLSGTDNALMVDETTPDGDTTYNSTATVGATDTHVVQDAPVVGAAILGVQLVTSVKKADAGTCSVAPVVRHSGVDYPGAASAPGTSYAYVSTPYGLNPGTGAPWTEAHFNAAEFGYKRTA